ncbi:hypothetical protein [Mycobacterium sp.]|uniref:hypothetical protein n=1 Tax=Mycobacterium sp. TaxID=1785 RepID=UPI003F977BA8
MTGAAPVAIDLTDEGCELIVLALNEYAGTAQHTYKLLCSALGQSTQHEWYQLTTRLKAAIKTRSRCLTSIGRERCFSPTFRSEALWSVQDCVSGAGDEYWFGVLRSLQEKVSTYPRFLLLLQNASYPAAE